jgi:hypothetical protein
MDLLIHKTKMAYNVAEMENHLISIIKDHGKTEM